MHAQLCLTLQLHGLQPTRLSVHGIFQARIPKWVAISFSIPTLQKRLFIMTSLLWVGKNEFQGNFHLLIEPSF